MQLPPSLAYETTVAEIFFMEIRKVYGGGIALEGRQSTWCTQTASDALLSHRVSRVLAEPVRFEEGGWPAGDLSSVYVCLHGSSRMYYSAYARDILDSLATRLELAARSDGKVWFSTIQLRGQLPVMRCT